MSKNKISARKCHQNCEPKYLAVYEDEPKYVVLCEESFHNTDFKIFAEIYVVKTGKNVFTFEIDWHHEMSEFVRQRSHEFFEHLKNKLKNTNSG